MKYLIAAIVVGLVACAFGSVALAARITPSIVLTSSGGLDPASTGDTITISGCGFGKHVFVRANYDRSLFDPVFQDVTTTGGCLPSGLTFQPTPAGTWYVTVYDRKGSPTSLGNVVAERSFASA